jgi:diguanylate cyclase (GGDEF)-like protein
MILSDLMMPEMDGYELHRILQEKSSGAVPIMFMTADDSDESESHGFEIGAADYIRKPLKADILMRRVSNILENLDKVQNLQQAADIDTMTGLLNKAAATRELEKICVTSGGVFLMIDLDSFKLVNDIHGHAMGDKILIALSELLRHITQESDLVGRMGGDEFVAFCQNVNSEKAVANKTKYLNEKITDAAKKLMGENMNIPLGVSIGAVFVPHYGTDFAEIFKKADNALYKVKQNGKHGYNVYSEEKNPAPLETSADISQILEERNIAGAYVMDFEAFKIIYRHAVRMVTAYRKDFQLLTINVDTDDENATTEIIELLKFNLRVSDCITHSGKNKILILLPETKENELNFMKLKLSAKISTSKNLSKYKIDFEVKKL